MRRLWTEDAFSFDGEFHTIDRASILPRPSARRSRCCSAARRRQCSTAAAGSATGGCRSAPPTRRPPTGSPRLRAVQAEAAGRLGRVHDPRPGPVRRRRSGTLGVARRQVARARRHPPRDRHPQRRRRPTSTATSPGSPSTRRRCGDAALRAALSLRPLGSGRVDLDRFAAGRASAGVHRRAAALDAVGEHVVDVRAVDEAVGHHLVDRARLGEERRASPRDGGRSRRGTRRAARRTRRALRSRPCDGT